jgi:hypothetical protein
MVKKRDANYFKKRLKLEFPVIHAEYRDGKLKSVREAAIKAGLVKNPTRVDALKREWKGATLSERREFVVWIKASIARSSSKTRVPIVTATGRLAPSVASFLSGWLESRKVRAGQIMKQMGFSNFDYRLSEAIGGAPISNEIVPALTRWLARNGFKWK